MDRFIECIAGAYAGGAIGDAMGAPLEGWGPERIRTRYPAPVVETFIPPQHIAPDGTYGKGSGRITDDTLMSEALIDAYIAAGDHLDAHGWATHVLPNLCDRSVFVPERQREMPLVERLWWPEKYPYIRMRHGNVDPRSAGVGNCVNCGIAMYAWPTGAINAGDPVGAYHEAASWAMAHNESFAVEAAAVMAAASAAAFGDGGLPAVLSAARDLARDGTKAAVAACLDAVDQNDPFQRAIARIRSAVAPYDQRTGHVSDDAPLAQPNASDLGRPSRLASIEELPVALAALAWGGDDWRRVLGLAVWYGRDNDSIAGMALGLWGAIHGLAALPATLVQESKQVNRRDYRAAAGRLAATARAIQTRDAQRLAARNRAMGAADA